MAKVDSTAAMTIANAAHRAYGRSVPHVDTSGDDLVITASSEDAAKAVAAALKAAEYTVSVKGTEVKVTGAPGAKAQAAAAERAGLETPTGAIG